MKKMRAFFYHSKGTSVGQDHHVKKTVTKDKIVMNKSLNDLISLTY